MAVIADYVCKTGARIVVHDDDYRDLSPEEYAARKQRVSERVSRLWDEMQIKRTRAVREREAKNPSES